MTSTQRNLELAGSAAFAVIAIIAIVLAVAFPPASRIVPITIGVAMLAVALFQGGTILFMQRASNGDPAEARGEGEDAEDSAPNVALLINAGSRKRTAKIILLALMLIGLIPLVGYPIAIGIFVLVSLVAAASEPNWAAAVCAGAAFTMTYALFDLLLDLEPFTGLAFDNF